MMGTRRSVRALRGTRHRTRGYRDPKAVGSEVAVAGGSLSSSKASSSGYFHWVRRVQSATEFGSKLGVMHDICPISR